jgi:hypothetical protein
MLLIGILQADGLARIEAIRISLQVSWNAMENPEASGGELDDRPGGGGGEGRRIGY